MKNKLALLLVTVSAVFMLSSCEDFIGKNLAKQDIQLISPPDGYVSGNYTLTFKWDDLKGVEKYRFELFAINKMSQELFLLDTAMRKTQYVMTLNPGSYKWQVRGENNSSNTEYSSAYFKVDSTKDLGNQIVELIAPKNDSISDSFEQTFTWNAVPTAVSYIFQVDNTSQTVFAATATYTFKKTGKYTWSVFAQNATSKSKTASANITIDTIKLASPGLTSPLDKDTTTLKQLPVTLKWSGVKNATSYNVKVSEDATFASGVMNYATTNSTLDVAVDRLKKIYWRVAAVSASGSTGAFSATFMFRVNN